MHLALIRRRREGPCLRFHTDGRRERLPPRPCPVVPWSVTGPPPVKQMAGNRREEHTLKREHPKPVFIHDRASLSVCLPVYIFTEMPYSTPLPWPLQIIWRLSSWQFKIKLLLNHTNKQSQPVDRQYVSVGLLCYLTSKTGSYMGVGGHGTK